LVTLALLLAVLITFSGAFLLVWLIRTRHPDGLLYGAVTLVLVVNTTLLTLYHFDELVMGLAAHPAIADLLVDVVVALKVAAKASILALLFRKGISWGPRRPWWPVVAGAWVVFSLLPLPVWVGELAFLGLAAHPLWRLWPGPLAAYVPLKALVVLIDAFLPSGLPPLWSVGLDLGFYFALNIVVHRWVLTRPLESRAPGSWDWGAFGLSPREQETAELLVGLVPYKQIAARLFVSVDTVKSHARAVYRKTGCHNRQELARRARVHPGFTPEITPVRDGKDPVPGGH